MVSEVNARRPISAHSLPDNVRFRAAAHDLRFSDKGRGFSGFSADGAGMQARDFHNPHKNSGPYVAGAAGMQPALAKDRPLLWLRDGVTEQAYRRAALLVATMTEGPYEFDERRIR
jgi:hypothetical protein